MRLCYGSIITMLWLCCGCCYVCCVSQKRGRVMVPCRINVSAVPKAPRVPFQPLSLSLAYPRFSEECRQDSVNHKTTVITNRISNTPPFFCKGLLQWLSRWRSHLQCRRGRRHQFSPWVGTIPWWRKWELTPVFFLRKSHEQRRLAGYSSWGHKELDTTTIYRSD